MLEEEFIMKKNVFVIFSVFLLALVSVLLGFLPYKTFDWVFSVFSFTGLGSFMALIYLICLVEQDSKEKENNER
jgi:uncharacterized protein YybS (DUF2232 family)